MEVEESLSENTEMVVEDVEEVQEKHGQVLDFDEVVDLENGEPEPEHEIVELEGEEEINVPKKRGRKKGTKNKKSQPQPSESGQQDAEGDEGEQDENEADYPRAELPESRIKKIMAICMSTEEEDDDELQANRKGKDKQGKGSNLIITKEAKYLMTLATEYFISLIGERAGAVTTSNKKKTVSFEFLRQALSDTDAFSFLEGCFQPSVIRGD